jgi:hypothetical protein
MANFCYRLNTITKASNAETINTAQPRLEGDALVRVSPSGVRMTVSADWTYEAGIGVGAGQAF